MLPNDEQDEQRLDEGEGSKAHSSVKNCTTKKLAKNSQKIKEACNENGSIS